ncbi:hypothetical protein PGH42_12510 [Legionella pneumophila]|nr:hypothetical protein PGH42_12510 [Legionella pneumophila]
MKEKTAKQLKLFIIYLISYWLLSIISCLIAFGYDDSLRMLLASPKSISAVLYYFYLHLLPPLCCLFFDTKLFQINLILILFLGST